MLTSLRLCPTLLLRPCRAIQCRLYQMDPTCRIRWLLRPDYYYYCDTITPKCDWINSSCYGFNLSAVIGKQDSWDCVIQQAVVTDWISHFGGMLFVCVLFRWLAATFSLFWTILCLWCGGWCTHSSFCPLLPTDFLLGPLFIWAVSRQHVLAATPILTSAFFHHRHLSAMFLA